MSKIYLDYAAATPIDAKVRSAMEPFLADQFYNPSAIYLDAKAARQALEDARSQVAQALGAKAGEIVFTAGATEANNLAIQGIMRQYPDGEILTTAIEHESVLAPAGLFKRRLLAVDKRGRLDLAQLQAMVSAKTVLVSVGLVNNEIGTIQQLAEISQLLNRLSKSRDSDRPLLLHSDAAQAPNFLDLNVARLGLDLLSLNGGKIYGPKQSGVLYVKAGTKLEPLIVGGGQEGGLRSGTENVAGCVGLATALAMAQATRAAEAKRLAALRQQFVAGVSEAVPRAQVSDGGKQTAPHIVSLTIAGTDNERLLMELDEVGIQVATGSACSASSDEPSHVLAAIGLSQSEARSTLRLSFGRQTTENDIERTIEALAQLTDSQQ